MSMLAAKGLAAQGTGWWRLVEVSLGYHLEISWTQLFHAFHPEEQP